MEKVKQIASVLFVLIMYMIGVYTVTCHIMTWTLIKAEEVIERARSKKLKKESNKEEV